MLHTDKPNGHDHSSNALLAELVLSETPKEVKNVAPTSTAKQADAKQDGVLINLKIGTAMLLGALVSCVLLYAQVQSSQAQAIATRDEVQMQKAQIKVLEEAVIRLQVGNDFAKAQKETNEKLDKLLLLSDRKGR